MSATIIVSGCVNSVRTHPEVEEDAKEGKGAEEAAGQRSHKPGLFLGRDHLSVPFSAGRVELQHS